MKQNSQHMIQLEYTELLHILGFWIVRHIKGDASVDSFSTVFTEKQ